MKLKEIIKHGVKVKISNGVEIRDAQVCRVNKTCFILSSGTIGTLTFSFSGRIINPRDGEELWGIIIDSPKEDLFNAIAEIIKPVNNIKPKNAVAELKIWNEDSTNFHYVIKDSKGGEMILNRGPEYLEFKIAQQEHTKRRNN